MHHRLATALLLGAALVPQSCSAERAGTLAAGGSNSPLACAESLGTPIAAVRKWMGLPSDGSKDATVNVVDLTAQTGRATFLLTSAADLVCGGAGADAVDLGKVTSTDNSFVDVSDVVLGGGGDDRVETLAAGWFVGGDGNDQIGVLNRGVFDGGDGDDEVGDAMVGGTFSGGPGNDQVFGMAGGTFDGGDGDDSAGDASHAYIAGTLVNVEH